MRGMDNEQSTPGSRLRALIKSSQYDSVAHFARGARKSPNTVRAHISGERQILPEVARAYGRLLGRPPEYILYGKRFNQVGENAAINAASNLASYQVPLLDCRDMEQWGFIVAGSIPVSETKISAPTEFQEAKRTAAFMMQDPSMEGVNKEESISQGEYVFIDPDGEYATGEAVVAIAPGFDSVIVRKYRVKAIGEGGKPCFDLVALNPDYPSVFDAHEKDVQIIGPVVGAFRLMRRRPRVKR